MVETGQVGQRPQSSRAENALVGDVDASSWLLVFFLGGKLHENASESGLMAGPPGPTSSSSPYASAHSVL